MPEPRIQYTHTSDGVSIAFWTIGAGPALLFMPNIPWSNVELEWRLPELRPLFERLSHARTVIRYDGRGTGLSERSVDDFSVAAHLRDVDAVVSKLGLTNIEIFAPGHGGPPAIAYAGAHPDLVSRLILWCTYARGADYIKYSPRLSATRVLMDQDWELYTETMAHVTWGWSAGEQARSFAAFIRQSVDVGTVERVREAIDGYDVSKWLPEIRCPTLVMHRKGFFFPSMEASRQLAAEISGSHLALLEGSSPAPALGDAEAVVAAISEFLDADFGPPPATPIRTEALPSLTILFTDIEKSTALTQRLGDEQAQGLLHVHNRAVRSAITANGGSEIKHTGDGIMASFTSASQALTAALQIQDAMEAHNSGSPDARIAVRIGMNAGEPVEEAGDLFGTAVQLAARICERAQPGQILASNVVRELAAGKRFLFGDCGEVALRGFEEAVRLFEVRRG